MKTNVTTILAMLLIAMSLNAQTGLNKDEDLFGSVFIDPTFEDSGFQFGAEILKEMEWFYVSAAVSSYPELKDGYTDLNITLGAAVNFFQNQNLTLYPGAGGGVNFRGEDPYGMIRLRIKLQVKLLDNLYGGFDFWVDHREDQKDEFYGDSDGHKPGIIFKGPLSQENVAGFITFKLN